MPRPEKKWKFELRFTGEEICHPDDTFFIRRSDDMIGNGGCVMLTNLRLHKRTEIEYRDLSVIGMRDVVVDGAAVVRIQRNFNGMIVGEWIPASAAAAQVSNPNSVPQRVTPAQAQSAGSSGEGDALANALKLAGSLFGQSKSDGFRALGSFLSNISAGGGQSPEVPPQTDDKLPVRAAPVVRQPTAPTAPTAPTEIPKVRVCTQCSRFRPYVATSTRFEQELFEFADSEAVSRGLSEIRSAEEKGKGEEARHLADLFRQGSDRWLSRPAFFSYCGAHEQDQREPTFFIAQIRNADASCGPVKRSGGEKWNDAATDFMPKDPIPHSCSTCVHRVRPTKPGEIAAELAEIVDGAKYSAGYAGLYGQSSGTGSLASSYYDTQRRDAGANRAREMMMAFSGRASDTHTPIAPRFLAICGLKSDPSRNCYRVCAIENANETCADWSPD